jgi:hypothetical protein
MVVEYRILGPNPALLNQPLWKLDLDTVTLVI